MFNFLFSIFLTFPILSHQYLPTGYNPYVQDKPIQVQTWQLCFGVNRFAVVSATDYYGDIDKTSAQSLLNGLKANLSMYVVASPCLPNVQTAKAQMESIVSYYTNSGIELGGLWLNTVVLNTGCWSKNQTENIEFIQQCVDALTELKVVPMIYADIIFWNQTTGNTVKFRELPLWYIGNDGAFNYNDFQSFGGWTTPTFKSTSVVYTCDKVGWYTMNEIYCSVYDDTKSVKSISAIKKV